MAHALHHWRYALNQTVLSWLAEDGQLTPAKIVERSNLRQKKREKAANKVVDNMEATGVMKDLYRQFKENLAAARDAKVWSLSKHSLLANPLVAKSRFQGWMMLIMGAEVFCNILPLRMDWICQSVGLDIVE